MSVSNEIKETIGYGIEQLSDKFDFIPLISGCML